MQLPVSRLLRLAKPASIDQFVPAILRSLHNRHTRDTTVFGTICDDSTDHPVVVHSTTDNPFLNLALENALLANTDKSSHVLLFYTNRPCIVIGRNQNPWLECNIPLVQQGIQGTEIDLLRRRSGGGAVFHDHGNLNFSVIVPNDNNFTRRKHAEMVTRALKSTALSLAGYKTFDDVYVNERHDIVMSAKDQKFKVSGSAFKLTRGRALHHGTLLHSSPNLRHISLYLKSAGRDAFRAKGVESVRSPVHNLFAVSDDLRQEVRSTLTQAIVAEFVKIYGPAAEHALGDDIGNVSSVKKDCDELGTMEWKFGQTPRFDFKPKINGSESFFMSVNHGIIEKSSSELLQGVNLVELQDTTEIAGPGIARLLQEVFPFIRTNVSSFDTAKDDIVTQKDRNIVLRFSNDSIEVEKRHNTIEQQ